MTNEEILELTAAIKQARQQGAAEQRQSDIIAIQSILDNENLVLNHEEDNYDAGKVHAFMDAIEAIRAQGDRPVDANKTIEGGEK